MESEGKGKSTRDHENDPRGVRAESTESAGRSRVFVVDDHPLICEALSLALDAQPDLAFCGSAGDARNALPMIRSSRPHAILLDLSLRGESGLELLRALRSSGDRTPVLILSMHREDLYSESVFRHGAQGYIMKEEGSQAILNALRKVIGGGLYLSERQSNAMLSTMVMPGSKQPHGIGPERLSEREREIFDLVGRGMNSGEIGKKLHISPRTVETHRTHIKVKLGLRTRAEMLHAAIRWVEGEGACATTPSPAASHVPPTSHRKRPIQKD